MEKNWKKVLGLVIASYVMFLTPHLLFSLVQWLQHMNPRFLSYVNWTLAISFYMTLLLLLTSSRIMRGLSAVILIVYHTLNVFYLLSESIQGQGFNAAFFATFSWDTFISVGVEEKLFGIAYLVITLLSLLPILWLPAYLEGWLSPRKADDKPFYKKRGTLLRYVVIIMVLFLTYHMFCKTDAGESLEHYYNRGQHMTKVADYLWQRYPDVARHYDKEPDVVAPQKAYNIVWIFAESLEQGYFNQKKVPHLMENLGKMKNNSYDFVNMKQIRQIDNTEFGTFAELCGVWINADPIVVKNKKWRTRHLCLPQILVNHGYTTLNLSGIPTTFSNMGYQLHAIGFQKTLGHENLVGQYPHLPYNAHWFGFFDKGLFKIATHLFNGLTQKKKPFFLAIATMDNHEPFTRISPFCRNIKETNPLRKSSKCTDKTVSEFLQMVRHSSVSKNTIIVVTSDHLNPWRDKTNATLKQTDKERRLTFFINFPDGRSKKITSKGTHYDVAPTVLDALGFKGRTDMGFGRSLLKHKKGFLYSVLSEAEANDISWADDAKTSMENHKLIQ